MSIDFQGQDIAFKDDQLEREQYAESIISLVKNFSGNVSENKSFVLALDSPWGTGKSVFCRMLKNKIIAEEPLIKTIYYNAWDNDYCANAFHALFTCLLEADDIFDGTIKEQDKELFRTSLLNVLKAVTKDAASCVHLENFADAAMDMKRSYSNFLLSADGPLKDHNEQRQAFDTFKKLLQNNSSWLKHKDHKLLIIVDELDRCKPLFAIETLEIIKHLFDIPNVVFLLSVDFSQLKHSIATIYGQEMDSEGYLRRFVNYVLKLPEPTKADYIEYLIQQYPLITDNQYKTIFQGNFQHAKTYYDRFKNGIKTILNFESMSLRDINVVYEIFYNNAGVARTDRLKINNNPPYLLCYGDLINFDKMSDPTLTPVQYFAKRIEMFTYDGAQDKETETAELKLH